MDSPVLENFRALLCSLGDLIRERLAAARSEANAHQLAEVAEVTAADTIYRIDKISEAVITDWFQKNWPSSELVELVMEGIEGGAPLTFPKGTAVAGTRWKCIIDPIDGTRCLMHEKRSAWVLAGIAPQRGPNTQLGDIIVAAMTELPTSKQWRADQLSAVRGGGLVAEAIDVVRGGRKPLRVRQSSATDLGHGFAAFTKFFPAGKILTAQIEEAFFKELNSAAAGEAALVFDDQYLSTGGQIYELIVGHDRFVADLRPLVFAKLGDRSALTCHPYDICCALIAEEAGVLIEKPDGGKLDAPLDTTSAVAWVGFANARLAEKLRPALQRTIARHLGKFA